MNNIFESGDIVLRYSLFVYIHDMCTSLVEASEFIKTSEDRSLCSQLLTDCGDVLEAIESTLNNEIDSVKEQKIFESISLCKEQAAELYRIIQTGKAFHEDALTLVESVQALRRLFVDGINVIYRIVFFAELGSKWDSMNSVYRAFKDRKDCDVAVVLAPIYRAVKSGETVLTDVIYEDYLTPMGIKHIPYQQYDISKDLPDMVFISNPYESVTLPQFWPENIAKYTRLVYLPYYTGMAISQESIKVHCYMPVAQYAWRIIAQSKKIKEIHQKYAPKHGDNILVTGLPKWDDIFWLKENPVDIDANWERRLRGKKVFLWNSHYAAKSNTSTLLQLGKDIIDFFGGRDDVALIWRPHPMTETIFKLYLPQYSSTWEKLKSDVEKADNMILDNNTSYNMSFQYSDALISDWSSMLTQYILTEKPILLLEKVQENVSRAQAENLDYIVHVDHLEHAATIEQIVEFIEQVVKGVDSTKEKRLQIIKDGMPEADGHVGERVCSLLLDELKKENEIYN